MNGWKTLLTSILGIAAASTGSISGVFSDPDTAVGITTLIFLALRVLTDGPMGVVTIVRDALGRS